MNLNINIDLREIKERIASFYDTSPEDFWNGGITVYFFCEDYIPLLYRESKLTECKVSFGHVSERRVIEANMITVPAKKGVPITFESDIDDRIIKAVYAGIHLYNPEYKNWQFNLKRLSSKSIYI